MKYVTNWSYLSYGDAEYIEHVLAYYRNNIDYIGAKVQIDGKNVKFSDQYPIILNGTTLIPIRAVSEKLGASVTWDGDNQRAVINKAGTIIELYINNTTAYINGAPYTIEVPAQMMNDRTLVPLRFVAESLALDVNWNGDTRTVEITEK